MTLLEALKVAQWHLETDQRYESKERREVSAALARLEAEWPKILEVVESARMVCRLHPERLPVLADAVERLDGRK